MGIYEENKSKANIKVDCCYFPYGKATPGVPCQQMAQKEFFFFTSAFWRLQEVLEKNRNGLIEDALKNKSSSIY